MTRLISFIAKGFRGRADASGPTAALTPHSPLIAPWHATLLLVGALTLARLIALFVTPLELYPDEAQYWVWAQSPALGYYSKPPLIAWLIAGTTALGGDSEPFVRLSSPLLHAIAALALFKAGERLFDARTGLWAAVIYSLMPGVQLSAGVASTDAALLCALSLALWASACLGWRDEETRGGAGHGPAPALALGIALGLALLSKYAALYFLAGLVLHAIVHRSRGLFWSAGRVMVAALATLLLIAPNLIWNALNDFATVSHTADNANWTAGALFHPLKMLEFLASQFGVFGPVPFAILAMLSVMAARRRKLEPRASLLLTLALVPIVIVTVQALLSRAHANWAAAAYVPASVLVAHYILARGQQVQRRLKAAIVIPQAAIAAVFILAACLPSLADAIGLAGSFKRARGWEATTRLALSGADSLGEPAAIVVDDRFTYNALRYYGRAHFGTPGGPGLLILPSHGRADSQAEIDAPLTSAETRLMLGMALDPARWSAQRFDVSSPWRAYELELGGGEHRTVHLAILQGYQGRDASPD
ncbi:MAG: ArnT family glycosyltransferase [Brevundimonas sp.]|jgi:4-amino-4-deoxy-L-arabinose transferase-like glycosyltransferase|uniref:ArnT family glycosyltransferase n=1 Tax=Brevundimonas sp. TaxID=1871086 RepID=UPI00391BF7FC